MIGTVVIAGQVYQITRLGLRGGKIVITAFRRGPTAGCTDEPATVFGEDGLGVCQSWGITIPAYAGSADTVTVFLPFRITAMELEP